MNEHLKLDLSSLVLSSFIFLPLVTYAQAEMPAVVEKVETAVTANSLSDRYFSQGQAAMQLAAKKRVHGEGVAAELLESAIASFEACHEVGDAKTNRLKNLAIYFMGQCSQKLGEYDEALKAYERFERNWNRKNEDENAVLSEEGEGYGEYLLDRSICHFKAAIPRVERGAAGLGKVLGQKGTIKYKLDSSAVKLGFLEYCAAVQRAVKKEKDRKKVETTEHEFVQFVARHRAAMSLSPSPLVGSSSELKALVEEMRAHKLDRAAIVLQVFFPALNLSDEDLTMLLTILVEDKKPVVEEAADQNVKKGAKAKSKEVSRLIELSQGFESRYQFAGALAVYEIIEFYYPEGTDREKRLFDLARCGYNTGAIAKVEQYGETHLREYPRSYRVSNVREFLMGSYFRFGNYEECIAYVEKQLPAFPKAGRLHEFALYCLGGSYYYLGKFSEANKVFSSYLSLYGKRSRFPGINAMEVQYWDASNESYLNQWETAVAKLERFLAAYPRATENKFFSVAKYDLAYCYEQLGEPKKVLELLGGVVGDLEIRPLLDKVFTLRGTAHSSLGDVDAAYRDYCRALKYSRKLKNKAIEAEVLCHLVELLGDDSPMGKGKQTENYKLAIPYYDAFWNTYSKGPLKTDVAISGLAALTANGRGVEGLANLKQVITELGKGPDSQGIGCAVAAYTEAYLAQQGNDVKNLQRHYANDFHFGENQVLAQIILKMSVVNEYGKLVRKARREKDLDHCHNLESAMEREIQELTRLEREGLSDTVVLRLADCLEKNATQYDSMKFSGECYAEVFVRAKKKGDSDTMVDAAIGLVKSSQPIRLGGKEKAKVLTFIADLKKVRDDSKSAKINREKADYAILALRYAVGDDMIANAHSFLDKYPKSNYRTQVYHILAGACMDCDQFLKAVAIYQGPLKDQFSSAKYRICLFCRSLEVCEKIEGKYSAYLLAHSFVKMCEEHFEGLVKKGQLSAKEWQLWEHVKNRATTLEADPEVQKRKKENSERQ